MRANVIIGSVVIDAELAVTSEAIAQGLSGRVSLGKKQGMLFVLDKASYPVFWMRGMQFPLDIVWINAYHKVVDITKNLDSTSHPQSAQPKESVEYVLEVNSGFVATHGIGVGDRVYFSKKISVLKFLSELVA